MLSISATPLVQKYLPYWLFALQTWLVFHTNQVRAITIPRDRKIPEGEMLLFGLHPEITEFWLVLVYLAKC